MLLLRLFRDETGDGRMDRIGPEVLHDGDALVSLLHIKAAEVFVGFDRVAEPFIDLGIIEGGPFGGKLRIVGKERHEIAGKRILPPAGSCAGKEIERHLEDAEGILGCNVFCIQEIIERGEIRTSSGELRSSFFMFADASGILVICDQV